MKEGLDRQKFARSHLLHLITSVSYSPTLHSTGLVSRLLVHHAFNSGSRLKFFPTKLSIVDESLGRVLQDSTLLSMDIFKLISPLGLSSGETRSFLIIHFRSKNGLIYLKHCEEVPSMAEDSGYPGLRKRKEILCRGAIALSVLQKN